MMREGSRDPFPARAGIHKWPWLWLRPVSDTVGYAPVREGDLHMSCREAAPRATHLAGSPQKLIVPALPKLAGSLPPSLCEAPAAKDPQMGLHLLTWMPGQRPKKTTCRETGLSRQSPCVLVLRSLCLFHGMQREVATSNLSRTE